MKSIIYCGVGITPEDIDLIICNTITPDYFCMLMSGKVVDAAKRRVKLTLYKVADVTCIRKKLFRNCLP